MVEGILNYIQSFLVLFLLMKVLLFLIPRSSFEKYISFFSGVILVLGMLQPMLSFFKLDESLQKNFYIATFEKQALEASVNIAKISSGKEDFYNRQMETFVGEEIKKQMKLVGIPVKEIEVVLDGDYEVSGIKVVVLGENEEENAKLLQCLKQEYHLSAAQYEIVYE